MKKGLSIRVLPVLILLSVLLMPIAAAQFAGAADYVGYYISYLVQTYLFRFLLLTLLLFAVFFFSLKNFLFKGNASLSAVAAGAASLLIAPTVLKYFEDYLAFGDFAQLWIIGAAAIILVFLLYAFKNWKDFKGSFGGVFKAIFNLRTILVIYLVAYFLIMIALPPTFLRSSIPEYTRSLMTVGVIISVLLLVFLGVRGGGKNKPQKQPQQSP